jgi:hypothetical protein
MPTRSSFPKYLTASAAAAALALGSGASAFAAGPSPSTVDQSHASAAPEVIELGVFDNDARTTFEVDVPIGGEYQLSYFLSYPDRPAQIGTTVDGVDLADLTTPAKPGTYGVIATTGCFELSPGRHVITVQATALSFPIGLANLIPVEG